ncbi:MAG TPA: hypothetical protein PLK55_02050 [archaeon]|nr:hypothetical protein [archaeon]
MPRKFGKIREPIISIKRIKRGVPEKEEWPMSFGKKERFISNPLYLDTVVNINTKNKSPKILIMGPGLGEEIIEFDSFLKTHKHINPQIESLGITNQLTKDALKTVKKDHSLGIALEEIDPENPIHKQAIKKLIGRFDYIIAPVSVGIHTRYPAYNCFLCALALKPQGEARINIMNPESIKSHMDLYKHQLTETSEQYTPTEIRNITANFKLAKLNYNQVSKIEKIIYRMLNSYFKKDVKDQFFIKIRTDSSSKHQIIVIKRNY